MPMNPSTINASTFILKQGTTPVSGTVTYSGLTATFRPNSQLTPNTIYTGTITIGTKNTDGVSLANNYIWTFATVNMTPPVVISTIPAKNSTSVVLNQKVSATFSMPMDPLTLNNETFTLSHGGVSVSGTISYSGSIATFNPSRNLLPGTVYTATIRSTVKNTLGTPMSDNYIWTFTTIYGPAVISTYPVNNAANVALTKNVTATFSMPMDPSSINTTTFTLKHGTTSVAGTVTYSGSTATFTPSGNLFTGTTYTATITTGATNVAGTPLASNYIWTFSTGAVVAPTVISTDPLNNATNVALTKKLTATFSVPMDPTSMNATTFTLKHGTISVEVQ